MSPALLEGLSSVSASLWGSGQPWWEFSLRAVLIYGFLLVVHRLLGKRQVSQLTPFDLVMLIMLSNAVQNSMNGGNNTVTAGVVLVLTLVLANTLVGWICFKSKRAELLIQGKPQILVHNGCVDESAVARQRITRHELMAAIRQVGLTDLEQVHIAILEGNGRINVIGKHHIESAKKEGQQ